MCKIKSTVILLLSFLLCAPAFATRIHDDVKATYKLEAQDKDNQIISRCLDIKVAIKTANLNLIRQ